MSERILILEEDISLREVLVEVLEEEGFEVRAIGQIRQLFGNPQETPDLLLAGTRALGPQGWKSLAALKKAHPSLRVVLLASCHPRAARVPESLPPPDGCLHKPFELSELQRMVRRVLRRGRAAEACDRLLGRFLSGSKELTRQVVRVRMRELESDRDRLYLRYLAEVRSGTLQAGPALELWDRLEDLECLRQRALATEPVDLEGLRAGYRFVADLVLAKGRAAPLPPTVPREPGRVPRKVFADLYGRLKRGEISADQLKEAPRLRMRGPGEKEGSAGERALCRALWGPGD